MRIGIDARIYSGTGIARYVRNLIYELEQQDKDNDYIIFISSKDRKTYNPKNNKFKKWVVDAPLFSFAEQTSLLLEYYKADLDVLHIPNFNAPIFYTKKYVVTIHDLTMLDYNVDATSHDIYTYKIKSFLAKLIAKRVASKAAKIICPTNFVKTELIRLLKVKKEKLFVAYEGVDTHLAMLAPKELSVVKAHNRLYNIEEDEQYLLYVGSNYPHKNLQALLVAFKEIVENNDFTGKLILAGPIDLFAEKLNAFVYGLKLENRVVFAAKYTDDGKLTDEDIAILYKGAKCYVFPSKKEGFSLTPLEAQSFGVPVILSDIPVHKEVFDKSVEYFNPESPSEMYDGIKKILTDNELRSELITLGKVNVSKYSWLDMARKTLGIYNEINST